MPTDKKPTKKPLVMRLQERAIDFRAGLPVTHKDPIMLEEAIAEIFRLEHLAKKNALPRSGEDL